jgi:hypothetical protein
MGRPPIGQTAMTPKERKRRQRDRLKAARESVTRRPLNGKVVKQWLRMADRDGLLKEPSNEWCDWTVSIILKAEYVSRLKPRAPRLGKAHRYARLLLRHIVEQRTYAEAALVREAQDCQPPDDPPWPKGLSELCQMATIIDLVEDFEAIELAEKSVRSLLSRFSDFELVHPGWTGLALMLRTVGTFLWTDGDRAPKAVTEGTPLHLFVCHGLGFFGIKRKPSTIAAALKKPSLKVKWPPDENEKVEN